MNKWIRVTRMQRCPICGKPDWCLIARDGEAVICSRISEGSERVVGEAGHLHRLDGDRVVAHRKDDLRIPEPPKINCAELHDRHVNWITTEHMQQFARDTGLSMMALNVIDIGWSPRHHALAFPMRSHALKVIGIRLRAADGNKFCVRGSRSGLFIQSAGKDRSTRLLICEGPTDTAAAFDLGYFAIGRPDCRGGVKFIERFLQHHKRDVIIVADRDGPGQDGARSLAEKIAPQSKSVKTITPPVKDLRQWLNEGATHDDVERLINV